MGRTIAVANQKGGVGKTTTAINLSACLAEKGMKVLTIDIDPQGNTTSGLGLNKSELEDTVYQLVLGECSIRDCMVKSVVENLYVLPSNVNLAGAEIELIGVEDREFILKKSVEQIKEEFDFIIIDCPPSLNTLTVNAMTTADSVLVPIQCEFYALEGLSQLIHTINLVKQRLNPSLEIEGVVFTMFDARTNLSLEVVENVRGNLDQKIYNSIIPRNVRLAESPSHGLPINMYDSKSAGAEAYRDLADEVINLNKKGTKKVSKEKKDTKSESTKKLNTKKETIKEKAAKMSLFKRKNK
nr:AAA family ATPase [Clostridium sp. Marseille-P299]